MSSTLLGGFVQPKSREALLAQRFTSGACFQPCSPDRSPAGAPVALGRVAPPQRVRLVLMILLCRAVWIAISRALTSDQLPKAR